MSVWTSARYIDDAWQFVARFLDEKTATGLASTLFLDRHTDGTGRLEPHIPPGQLCNLMSRGKLTYAMLKTPGRTRHSQALAKVLKDCDVMYHGLVAVNRLTVLLDRACNVSMPLAKNYSDFIRLTALADGAAGQLTPHDVKERSDCALIALETVMEARRRATVDLVKVMAFSYRAKVRSSMNGDKILFTKTFRIGEHKYECKLMPGAVFLIHAGRTYFLRNQDVDAIKSSLLGFGIYRYALLMHGKPGSGLNYTLRLKGDQILDLMHVAMISAKPSLQNRIVQAWDMAYHRQFADTCKDVSPVASDTQAQKWLDKKGEDVVSWKKIQTVVADLQPVEQKELLTIHRCLPVPDFDYFSHMEKQIVMYEEAKLPEEFKESHLDEIMVVYEYYLFVAYKERHGVWPGVPKNAVADREEYAHWPLSYGGVFTPEKVLEIDADGTFQYVQHTTDYLDLMKDSAICPDSVDEKMTPLEYYKINKLQRSQLLRVLGADELLNMSDWYTRMREMFWETRTDDKPEAKKPAGRWFFIMGAYVRLFQSEYEANVTPYIDELSQIAIGKAHTERITTHNRLGHPPSHAEGRNPLFISFDLAKWSPRLTTLFHKKIDAIWARLFGMPHLNEMYRAYEDGKMHYFKKNIHHSWAKMGRDFEGIAGKRLTVFHLAVMHAAVIRLKDAGLNTGHAHFTVYIDDGLLRLEKDGPWDTKTVEAVRRIIDQVYRESGLVLSWDKTYIHTAWNVFLNDEYFYSTKTPLSLRAFLKLTDRTEVAAPSLLQEIAFLQSRSAGSLVNDAFVYAVSNLFHYFLGGVLEKYNSQAVSLTGALWVFVPVSLGGLGVPSSLNLAGSVAGRAHIDGLGNLKRIAQRFRELAPAINRVINVSMKPMTTTLAITAPWTIRREGPTLVENRLGRAVERALRRQKDLPGLNRLLQEVGGSPTDAEEQLEAFSGTVSLTGLYLVGKTSRRNVFSQIASKILRSTSALTLVGKRQFARVVVGLRLNAQEVLRTWG